MFLVLLQAELALSATDEMGMYSDGNFKSWDNLLSTFIYEICAIQMSRWTLTVLHADY